MLSNYFVVIYNLELHSFLVACRASLNDFIILKIEKKSLIICNCLLWTEISCLKFVASNFVINPLCTKRANMSVILHPHGMLNFFVCIRHKSFLSLTLHVPEWQICLVHVWYFKSLCKSIYEAFSLLQVCHTDIIPPVFQDHLAVIPEFFN